MSFHSARLIWPGPALALLAMTLGCGTPVIEIGALEPVPAVRRAAGIAVPTLVLEGTPDALRIEGAGFPAVEIRSFRSTLTAGFARGFGRPAPAGKAGAILFLEVTRVFLAAEPPPDGAASAAQDRGAELLLAHGTHAFKQVGAPRRSRRFAVIEFEATLRDRGVEVSRIAGRAVSDRAAGPDPVEVGHALSSAVAAMYQRIDRALFARRMADHDASDEARDDVAGPRPWLFPVGTMTECDGYFDVEHDDAADCAAETPSSSGSSSPTARRAGSGCGTHRRWRPRRRRPRAAPARVGVVGVVNGASRLRRSEPARADTRSRPTSMSTGLVRPRASVHARPR